MKMHWYEKNKIILQCLGVVAWLETWFWYVCNGWKVLVLTYKCTTIKHFSTLFFNLETVTKEAITKSKSLYFIDFKDYQWLCDTLKDS